MRHRMWPAMGLVVLVSLLGGCDSVSSKIEIPYCQLIGDTAYGLIYNKSSATADVVVEVVFTSADGTVVGNGIDAVSGIPAGGKAEWRAMNLGGGTSHECKASVKSAVSN